MLFFLHIFIFIIKVIYVRRKKMLKAKQKYKEGSKNYPDF